MWKFGKFVFLFIYLQEVLSDNVIYRPIVLWHGMGDTCCSQLIDGTADRAKEFIQETLGNIYVKSISMGDKMSEDYRNGFIMHPNKQVAAACAQIQSDSHLANGYNAIGFSQGGLLLRAVAERCSEPPMLNLITLGSPHQGIFGMPKCPFSNRFMCKFMRNILNAAAYKKLSQKGFSAASYWHDPKHEDIYMASSTFLADINNENENRPDYAANLKRLQKFTMIKFNQDRVVEPISSQWFEFYAPGQDKIILPLNESEIYIKDKLGLKVMDAEGKLLFIETENDHLCYTRNWFINNVIVYLKYYKNPFI